jgi:SAM-dependent methyltransferase
MHHLPKNSSLSGLLDEPRLSGVEVGSSEWFAIQRELVVSRPLVHDTYSAWYEKMLGDSASAPSDGGKVLELGSGSNFVKLLDPRVITSDVVPGASDLVVDAQDLPFAEGSLKAILLTHVFHHIVAPERFLAEATRTLVPGGVISIIDVAHTPFARVLFTYLHPEGYHSNRRTWLLDESEPLGGANQAMTWMVFNRDIAQFRAEFPQLQLELIEYMPWLGYLISGGLTRRNLIPGALVPLLRALDRRSRALDPFMSLHWHIRIRKRVGPDSNAS